VPKCERQSFVRRRCRRKCGRISGRPEAAATALKILYSTPPESFCPRAPTHGNPGFLSRNQPKRRSKRRLIGSSRSPVLPVTTTEPAPWIWSHSIADSVLRNPSSSSKVIQMRKDTAVRNGNIAFAVRRSKRKSRSAIGRGRGADGAGKRDGTPTSTAIPNTDSQYSRQRLTA